MKYDYDLAVIGGGAAGLTAAGIGANFGARTIMIESGRLGGDCTWHGCVPSKTLLHAAKVAETMKQAKKFGADIGSATLDFSQVMQHVRNVRQAVYEEADHPDHFRAMNIDVEFGTASFVDKHTLEITKTENRQTISSRYLIIATGSRAMVPSIPGLDKVPYLTNETLFELEEQPSGLAIIGGGPIGIEMSQAFQRLGTAVTVIDRLPRILGNDDDELAGMLLDRLLREGVNFKLSSSVNEVAREDGRIVIQGEREGKREQWPADKLLVATGRVPNYEKLNLDAAGIDYTRHGITTDDRCRTSIPHIYAAGDVTGRYQLTHMSEHMAKIAVTNALLKIPLKIDSRHVPWCTYTDPELAHVGATEKSLIEEGTSYEEYRFPYDKIDRAVTDNETEGLIKLFAKKRTGKILGASVFGVHAAELISEYALAMKNGVTLRKMADTIHPYPSYGLGARRAADQWYIKSQSEWMTKLIQKVFRYRGKRPELDEDRIM